MIYRRLQRIGGGTLFISLPRSWVNGRGLKKGDIVEIEETPQGTILISPYQLSTNASQLFSSIKVEEEDRQRIEREVAAAYLSGKEIIRLLFNPDDYRVRKMVKDIGRFFLGLELVEEDADSVTYRFMLEQGGITPEKIFRRMNVIARSMYLDSAKASLERNEELLEDIKKRDEEIDRLYFLGVRMLRQITSNSALSAKYGLSATKALDYRVAYQHLEYMGDIAYTFSDDLFGEDRDFVQHVAQVIQKISALHDSAQLHFFGAARESYSSFLHAVSAVQDEIRNLARTDKTGKKETISCINEIIRLIVDIADLAGTLYPYVK
ncbi:MAG: phosphate uptake regulator PhoU [Conexivisphaerales archaeon]